MKQSTVVFFSMGLALLLMGCDAGKTGRSQNPAPMHASNHNASNDSRTETGGEPYHGLIQYRAKDAKEAIVDPVLLDPSEVIIAAGTQVIGVFINGEARAYPLFVLNNHQIVNDEVGGTPLAASW